MHIPLFQQPPIEMLNRRLEEARMARLERAKGEIASRIRRICAHLTPQDFDGLVTRMAQVQIKYTMRRSVDLFSGAESGDGSGGGDGDHQLS